MIDEWKEFTGETRSAAVESAKGHFSVSEERLDVRVIPTQMGVAGLGSRVLLLAMLKEEAPADLSDVGEFLYGVLQRMNWATKVRIAESDEDGDLVFKIRGPAIEEAARKDPNVVGALAHLGERVAQEILGEEVGLRIEVPRSERPERREGRDRDGRNSREGGRRGEGRGDRRPRGDSRGRNDDRGRGDDRGRRPRRGGDDGDERLEKMSREIAEEVLRTGVERTLDAMSSRERWVVHNAVKEIDGVTSESVGEHDEKRVRIVRE
jgi:predicted RNA-binding protein Jag